jgi:hypothetical protein
MDGKIQWRELGRMGLFGEMMVDSLIGQLIGPLIEFPQDMGETRHLELGQVFLGLLVKGNHVGMFHFVLPRQLTDHELAVGQYLYR